MAFANAIVARIENDKRITATKNPNHEFDAMSDEELELLIDWSEPVLFGYGAAPRSPKWRAFAKSIVRDHPFCAYCKKSECLQVHHKIPFHTDPLREMERTNVCVLCNRSEFSCHRIVGHRGRWTDIEPNIEEILAKHMP